MCVTYLEFTNHIIGGNNFTCCHGKTVNLQSYQLEI